MTFAKHLPMFSAFGAMVLSNAAAAAPIAAQQMLVSSSPAAASTQRDAVDTIALNFAEPVRMISVTLNLPDGSEMSVYPSEIDAAATKGKTFNFRLATPVTTAGHYRISYLLTSKSFKSLNGFIDFEVPEAGDTRLSDSASVEEAEKSSYE